MSTIEVSTAVPTGTWSVDPIHSSVGFGVKHLGVSTFRGSFPGFTGSVVTEARHGRRRRGRVTSRASRRATRH